MCVWGVGGCGLEGMGVGEGRGHGRAGTAMSLGDHLGLGSNFSTFTGSGQRPEMMFTGIRFFWLGSLATLPTPLPFHPLPSHTCLQLPHFAHC